MVCSRGDVDVHADVLVVERRDRLLCDAASGERGEGRHWHRHALTESRLRGHAFRGSELRVGQRPRAAVGLEQAVEQGW